MDMILAKEAFDSHVVCISSAVNVVSSRGIDLDCANYFGEILLLYKYHIWSTNNRKSLRIKILKECYIEGESDMVISATVARPWRPLTSSPNICGETAEVLAISNHSTTTLHIPDNVFKTCNSFGKLFSRLLIYFTS